MSSQKHASLCQELSNQAFHRHLAVLDPGARKINIMVYGAVRIYLFVFIRLSNHGEV